MRKSTRGYARKVEYQLERTKVSAEANIVGRFDPNLPLSAQRSKRSRHPPAEMGREGFDQVEYLPGPLAQKYRVPFIHYKDGPVPGSRYVDFSPHVLTTPGGQPMSARIKYKGSRAADFVKLDNIFGITAQERANLEGTWHHVPDFDPITRRGTIELVPTDLHGAIGHYGGVEQYKKVAATNGQGWPNRY